MLAIGRGHDLDVREALPEILVHPLHEAAELSLAGLAAALVHVMGDLLVQEANERIHVAAVKGGVVVTEQLLGLGAHRNPLGS